MICLLGLVYFVVYSYWRKILINIIYITSYEHAPLRFFSRT